MLTRHPNLPATIAALSACGLPVPAHVDTVEGLVDCLHTATLTRKHHRANMPPPAQEPAPTRLAHDEEEGHWVTIGGHMDAGKHHVGGHAVKIGRDGKIIGGSVPKEWHGKMIHEALGAAPAAAKPAPAAKPAAVPPPAAPAPAAPAPKPPPAPAPAPKPPPAPKPAAPAPAAPAPAKPVAAPSVLAAPAAPAPAPAKPAPKPQPPPAKTLPVKAVADAMDNEIVRSQLSQGSYGDVLRVHNMLSRAAGRPVPPAEFHALLRRMEDVGVIEMHTLNEPRGVPDEDLALMPRDKDGNYQGYFLAREPSLARDRARLHQLVAAALGGK